MPFVSSSPAMVALQKTGIRLNGNCDDAGKGQKGSWFLNSMISTRPWPGYSIRKGEHYALGKRIGIDDLTQQDARIFLAAQYAA